MKHMKFVTGSLLALALFSFVVVTSPMKIFATEKAPEVVQEETTSEEVQVILPDSLSEEDEKAINKMVLTYQRSRSGDPEQLEDKISNYFVAQYGTTRAVYVVEFKSQVNGSISGRLVYVLMGNDALKRLNEASGGFEVPVTTAKSGYAFDNWSYAGAGRVESNDLATYEIYGSSIFYAEFMPDTNNDGIPDYKQSKFNIQFHGDVANGTLGAGNQLKFVAFETVIGEGCYIGQAVGFQEPSTVASWKYAFDYWSTSEGTIVNDLHGYKINKDITIWPVFAVDENNDGIPDYKQTLYKVDILATSGGYIKGISNFIVTANAQGEWVVEDKIEMIYPEISDYNGPFSNAYNGYMFEYWIDHNGEVIDPYDRLWNAITGYVVKSDTVFVAVFTKDINGDHIPDYKQTFFNVDFMTTADGSIGGITHYAVAVRDGESVGYLGDAFPRFNPEKIKVTPNEGYILDYWIDHKGNQYSADLFLALKHALDEDTIFVAVFTEDANANGIPDYKENIAN